MMTKGSSTSYQMNIIQCITFFSSSQASQINAFMMSIDVKMSKFIQIGLIVGRLDIAMSNIIPVVIIIMVVIMVIIVINNILIMINSFNIGTNWMPWSERLNLFKSLIYDFIVEPQSRFWSVFISGIMI